MVQAAKGGSQHVGFTRILHRTQADPLTTEVNPPCPFLHCTPILHSAHVHSTAFTSAAPVKYTFHCMTETQATHVHSTASSCTAPVKYIFHCMAIVQTTRVHSTAFSCTASVKSSFHCMAIVQTTHVHSIALHQSLHVCRLHLYCVDAICTCTACMQFALSLCGCSLPLHCMNAMCTYTEPMQVPTFRAEPLTPACDNWCEFPVSDRPNAVRQFLDAAVQQPDLIQVSTTSTLLTSCALYTCRACCISRKLRRW